MIGTRLLRVDPLHPEESIVKEAAGVLLKGGLVAFPTETFYGLGANALDPAAVRRIFEVKGRPESKPLLVLVDSVRMAETLVKEIPAAALALMARYWPGPLTLIFRATSRLPEELTAGTGTVGIRMFRHPVSFEVVRAAGIPVTAPSANLSDEEPPITAADVDRTLRNKIDLILDGGPTTGGLPSTILDVTVTPAKVIRRGALELPE